MSKKIILCADGTWNSASGATEGTSDTNVRKFYLLLGEQPDQLKYYDSGVGTNALPLEHLVGGAFGQGLFQKVQDAYAFLAYVWDPGDEIYIVGFSRGAYTARSLAGMIAFFGVPTKNLDNLTVKRVFDAYRITDSEQRKQARQALDSTYSYGMAEVQVRMVGVWDTVGALGVPGGLFAGFDHQQYGFLDTSLSKCIQNAYHAVSLDERRSEFVPTLWTNADGSFRPNDAQLLQVWFPGVHCDVGGSYAEAQLSNVTLRWMIDNAEACGLRFDENALGEHFTPKEFYPDGPVHDSWKFLPYGLPKDRHAPDGAVLSNTVALRAEGALHYTSKALSKPISAYQAYTVIPPDEIATAPFPGPQPK